MTWVWLTLGAALMQAIRTAGQKSLSQSVNALAATFVRYAYGWPFAVLWAALVVWQTPDSTIDGLTVTSRFFVYALAASVMQIIATAALVEVFRTRNFAVGTAFAKTEVIITAVLAVALFGELLSQTAWLSVIGGVIGVLLISTRSSRVSLSALIRGLAAWRTWSDPAVLLGLVSGLSFALTALFLRQASLSLSGTAFLTAALTLVFMVSVQALICAAWMLATCPEQFQRIRAHPRVCVFVGLTAVLGSVGWFTAMTLQNAAYVKALGQVEFLLTLFITGRVFRESISAREGMGMALIVGSVCLLLLE